MFFMIFIEQMPTDPPTSFAALQWVMVGMLTAALVYVFRQWQAEKKNCTKQYLEIIDELMETLRVQNDNPEEVDITDVN